jgi:hypothetical protein
MDTLEKDLIPLKELTQRVLQNSPEQLQRRAELEARLKAEVRKAPNWREIGTRYVQLLDLQIEEERSRLEGMREILQAIIKRDQRISHYASALQNLTAYPSQEQMQRN